MVTSDKMNYDLKNNLRLYLIRKSKGREVCTTEILKKHHITPPTCSTNTGMSLKQNLACKADRRIVQCVFYTIAGTFESILICYIDGRIEYSMKDRLRISIFWRGCDSCDMFCTTIKIMVYRNLRMEVLDMKHKYTVPFGILFGAIMSVLLYLVLHLRAAVAFLDIQSIRKITVGMNNELLSDWLN